MPFVKRVICLLFLLPVLSLATTLTGSVQGPDGAPFTGTLMLTLNQPAVLLSAGSCGGPIQVASGAIVRIPVTSGTIPGGTSIYGNDCLSPVGTFYLVKMQDANGNIVYTTYWQVAGSTEDIGSIIPATPNALGSYSTITQVTVAPSGNCPANVMPEQLLSGQGGIYFCNPTTLLWTTSLSSISVDGYSVGFTLTSPSTITSIEDMFRVAINGCPTTIEYGGGVLPGVQGIVGCTQAPDNVTYSGLTSGVAGYALGGGGTATTPVAGGYFYGTTQNGNSSAVGVNGVGANFPASGIGVGVPFIAGGYFTASIAASGTPPVIAYGSVALLSAAVSPSSGIANGYTALATNVPWNIAYDSEPGGASIGVRLGPINATGTSNAQPLQMVSRSGSTLLQNQFTADSNGSMNWQPGLSTGAFNLVPLSSNNIPSPAFQFLAYSSASALLVAKLYEDATGDIQSLAGASAAGFNWYTSTGTFLATLQSNGNFSAANCLLVGSLGASWCQGSGAPGSTPGPGSLYSRTDTGQLYSYTGGQWVSKGASGCANILDYGGSALGSVSNNAAFNLILASATTQACVYLPGPGTYLFASAATWTAGSSNSAVTVKGDGANVSTVKFSAGGFQFNGSHTGDTVHVEGLGIATSGVGTATGISLFNSGAQNGFAASSIKDVNLFGADGYAATDYWASAITADSWSNLSIETVNIIGSATGGGTGGLGTGINIEPNGAVSGVEYTLHDIKHSYGAIGVQIGDLIQGVTIDQSNFTAVNTGVYVPSGDTYGDDDELIISNSQFNSNTTAINMQSPVRHTNIHDNYIIVPGAVNGMLFNNYAMVNAHDNQLINVGGGGGNGIVFSAYGDDASQVINNQTQFFTTGVWLQTTSSHTSAFANIGTSDTNELVNTGTGNPASVTFTGASTGAFQVDHGYVVHQ